MCRGRRGCLLCSQVLRSGQAKGTLRSQPVVDSGCRRCASLHRRMHRNSVENALSDCWQQAPCATLQGRRLRQAPHLPSTKAPRPHQCSLDAQGPKCKQRDTQIFAPRIGVPSRLARDSLHPSCSETAKSIPEITLLLSLKKPVTLALQPSKEPAGAWTTRVVATQLRSLYSRVLRQTHASAARSRAIW